MQPENPASGSPLPVPPKPPFKPRSLRICGEFIEDPYAGLRDLTDRDTQIYIDKENEYCMALGERLASLQDLLVEEFRGRMAEDDRSVSERIDGYLYYSRSRAGLEYEIHCRCPVGSGLEAIILDENTLAAGHDYFELGAFAVCPHHRLIAYTIDTVGDESYQLYISDIDSGRIIEGPVHDVSEDICWSEDAAAVFYIRVDVNGRPWAAFQHTLGTAVSEDWLLFNEKDPAFFLSLWKSRSRQYLFIEAHSNTTSEVYFINAQGIDNPAQCFRARERGVEYSIDHRPGEFLVLTNKDAPNFRLLTTPEHDLAESAWREIVPHRSDITLECIEVYASHLVVCERKDGVLLLRAMENETGSTWILDFPDPVYEMDLEDLDDFQSREIWVEYSAPTTPDTIYAYPLGGGERRILKAQELAGFDSREYETNRVWAPSANGISVPLTVIKKKTTEQPAPLLLMGYGAYEETYEVYFDCDLISLLERGVIVAIGHVRGGGELGRTWYEAGKLLNKENSFDDFVACAEYLIKKGYTQAGKIALRGSSAGGLLVAVTMQRNPTLFAAVVAEVPFVDVVSTLLDEEAPLTQYDREEFGDPSDEQVCRYIRNYSPYENVHSGVYPPLLVTAALEDRRVGAWEPLKWVAKLRGAKTDQNPLLLKIDAAGHHGQSGRYRELKHAAFVYAFLLDCWGLAH